LEIKGLKRIVLNALAILFLPLSAIAQDVTTVKPSTPKGKFVLRHQATIGRDGTDFRKFCTPFTENLNEFRQIDFQTCDARLSPKYPQFSRPQWEEISLDLDIARKILTNRPSINFERWINITEPERAAGHVKLWRLQIDFLKDGNPDTLVRLDHASDGSRPYCGYLDSKQMITGVQKAETARWYRHAHFFNSSRLGGDMIYDSITKRYYALDWNRYRGALGGGVSLKSIGATASVMVSRASDDGIHPVCWIDWVPNI